MWLRSTDFGDDKDRVLVKSDGEFTYLLPDIAYHRDKFARGFDLLIDVWGADHHGYVARMKAAMQALGHDPDELEVPIMQLVNLMKGGEPVQLSKRTGDIIELRDVLDEVGPDAARLTYLLQSIDSPQTFDIDVVTSQGNDNPVFYVQMAYARIRSIKRVAAERGVEPGAVRRGRPVAAGPRARARRAARAVGAARSVLAAAADDRAPHRITTWVRELAGAVHGFYHDCYVLGEGVSPELTQARLWLVEAAEIGPGHRPRPARGQRARVDVSREPASRRTLLPDTADGRRPRASWSSAAATRSSWRPSSARRCSSTTRPTCAPAAGRRSTAFGPGVNYATKAFLCRAMARLAVEEGMNLDVSTGGEYHVARSAGVPADRLVLHGNNKSLDELRLALAEGVGRIVVDSFDEIDRIEALVAEGLPAPKVLLRITPGVEAHTHEFVQTGQDDSKFGFGVASGAAAEAVERLSASPAVDLVGLHAHIGSQVFEARSSSWPSRCWPRSSTDHELPELSIGGGLGVAYVEGEEAPTIDRVGRRHPPGVRRRRHRAPGSPPSRAGPSWPPPASRSTPSARSRTCPASAPTSSVDGGMSDNPRPVLYGSGYETFLPRAVLADRPRDGHGGGQALRVGRPARARGPGAGRPGGRRHPVHAGHRRLRPLDGLELQQGPAPGGGVRRATARPAWSCGARPSTTCSPPTSTDVAPSAVELVADRPAAPRSFLQSAPWGWSIAGAAIARGAGVAVSRAGPGGLRWRRLPTRALDAGQASDGDGARCPRCRSTTDRPRPTTSNRTTSPRWGS